MTAALAQQTLAPHSICDVREISISDANDLLVRFGHYLGPCQRPFGHQSWALMSNGQPTAVAVSASTASSTAAGFDRNQLVELARMAACEPWATRVMLRLWRELCAPAWPSWTPRAAVAYSKNQRHEGRIYSFDGWTRVTDKAGSSGGGHGLRGAWRATLPAAPRRCGCGGTAR